MCPGLSNDLHVDDSRKTATIDRELTRLNIDIAALQETRLSLSGSLREQNYTFFWQGKEFEEPRLHGVGFAVRNSLLSSVEPPYSGTARILALRLSTSSGLVNLLSIYASTLCSSVETKDQFYEKLDTTIRDIPATEQLYLLDDFNARVGFDDDSWPSCTGHSGIGKLNKNGFANSIEDALKDCSAGSAEERWNHIRETIYNSATDTYGKRERQNPDWFEASIAVLEPAIEAKRVALINHKGEPSKKTHATLKKIRIDTKRIARRCASDYWLNLCQHPTFHQLQQHLWHIEPLKSASGTVITDRSKQVERWAEHYQELYSRENIVGDAAVESTANLLVMEELDIQPSEEELSKAIDSLACGKAPGKDGIPPEVIKAGKRTMLLYHLHQLLLQCWEGTVPQEMRDQHHDSVQEQG
ncbi:uncharacterized protein LOC143275811 [Babylonia areolata]|uniref:uncharacterized protein LOC143275811 n=1 Tax=Babylonia areolata TaxID=304850 RepID=UPI003FD503E0